MTESTQPASISDADRLSERFVQALDRLDATSRFAKIQVIAPVLDLARRLLAVDGGVERLYQYAERFQPAGVFQGTDWEDPERLSPAFVPNTLATGERQTVTVECMSELRWLAIAEGKHLHPGVSAEHARHFLTEVMALNLDFVFGHGTEALRERRTQGVRELFAFVADRIGYSDLVEAVVNEIWRILKQRPIQIDYVKMMIVKLAISLNDPETGTGAVVWGAERLISALFSPSEATRGDPGISVYVERLGAMDSQSLQYEASAMARAMHDTGLVSAYHPVLVRFLREQHPDLLAAALGLSSTGIELLGTYRELVHHLIDEAIYPETSQAVYGLTCLLERGILYAPPLAPGLWGQTTLQLSPEVEEFFRAVYGDAVSPKVHLLAGVLSVLGQPLGIGQGDNPTCQSARALAMWAYTDPDYLLQLVTWAARDGEIIMHFEGQPISSKELQVGLAGGFVRDLDPVSLLLVPHLDRIYAEMGRLVADRPEDPHKWINPEFHGRWVNRGFAIAVDIHTGKLQNYEEFVREFYANYHPFYNHNRPVIHPQPVGIAVTDAVGQFIGWHAITLLRVALDNQGDMRVYFYNPNNDSGQDWGFGVKVSTEGFGEYHGEASLLFEQFASRLYIFHYDPLEVGDKAAVPAGEVSRVRSMAVESWAANRIPDSGIPPE